MENTKKNKKIKTNKMENKKAGEEVSSSPNLDQEYEVHTSAPQEEMEFFLGNKFFSATKYMNM